MLGFGLRHISPIRLFEKQFVRVAIMLFTMWLVWLRELDSMELGEEMILEGRDLALYLPPSRNRLEVLSSGYYDCCPEAERIRTSSGGPIANGIDVTEGSGRFPGKYSTIALWLARRTIDALNIQTGAVRAPL